MDTSSADPDEDGASSRGDQSRHKRDSRCSALDSSEETLELPRKVWLVHLPPKPGPSLEMPQKYPDDATVHRWWERRFDQLQLVTQVLLALEGGRPLLLVMEETAPSHKAKDVADGSRELPILHIPRTLPSFASVRERWSEAALNILALATSVKDDVQLARLKCPRSYGRRYFSQVTHYDDRLL